MKIELKSRQGLIPRKPNGDPGFEVLEYSPGTLEEIRRRHIAVLDVFSIHEVVELVNRAIYQLEYQHNAHKVRAQRQRDVEAPVKAKVRELFHVPWSKATDEQIAAAVRAIKEADGDDKGV